MNRSLSIILFSILCSLFPSVQSEVTNAPIRVGFAQVSINAPDGTPLAGYYHARGSDGVVDELRAKALVLDDGKTQEALVTLDLISTTRSMVENARAEIERRTGIPAGNVMISATHTHTAPELADRGKRAETFLPVTTGGADASLQYTGMLPGWIADCVTRALSNAQPASLSVAGGLCEDLTFNRRFFMRDGSVAWNPGKKNPQIVLPAGGVDDSLTVVLAETAAKSGAFGTGIGAYVNFSMHPDTCGGTKLSADYPGALSRRLAEYHGPQFVTVFANGTCGNLNHVDVDWARPQQGPGEGNRIGTLLAASVFRAYKTLEQVGPGALKGKSTMVKLPLREVTPLEIEEAKKDVETQKDNTREGFMRLVRAYRNLDIERRGGKPWEVEVQVVTLGQELAWVSLPGEIFVELGLAIKKHSPFPHTMIAELANGSLGYIPDRRSYAEGNYEPESARCAAGSGEMLVEAALKLLDELKKE